MGAANEFAPLSSGRMSSCRRVVAQPSHAVVPAADIVVVAVVVVAVVLAVAGTKALGSNDTDATCTPAAAPTARAVLFPSVARKDAE